jgi:hypothetical protein
LGDIAIIPISISKNNPPETNANTENDWKAVAGFLAMKKKMTKQVEKAGREHVITICEN